MREAKISRGDAEECMGGGRGEAGNTRTKKPMKGTRVGRFAVLAAFVGTFAFGIQGCSMPSAPPNRYALVIGVQNYPNVGGLSYTDADATSMYNLLSSTGWNVTILTESAATKSGIKAAIQNLGPLMGSSGSLLVYFSGHGTTIGDVAYIAPWDTNISGSAIDLSTVISSGELNSWMLAIPADNRIMILDSCYSGGFVDDAASVDAAPANYGPLDNGTTQGYLSTAFANASDLWSKAFSAASDPTIMTISAAGSQELSYDDGGHSHGAFTYWFLQAGTDSAADTNGDRLITATEAYAYAKDKLIANWNAINYDVPNASYPYTPIVDPATGKVIMADFLPRISGGSGDIVLYDKR
ncbi:MAG TPA: caspase family protein [Rectinemataceae bacterium]|nr:caspase family protein [Rectinemataceae bacterium]